jgi:hypothetical protein
MKLGGKVSHSKEESQGTLEEFVTSGSNGRKDDGAKVRMDLLDLQFIEDVAKVLTFGANKYSDNNWINVPNAQRRYVAALLRHICAYERGEEYDAETKVSHLAHAGCCLMFLAFFEREGGGM